ncbi:MAG: carbamate kinase [Eubacteriales bacterium]|nr:carbamate kinase [Eubacteriales bacterium]MDD3073797.1 carbamate kinase [Eubacteriales bacterium]MDD4078403.1 carbamate kinase [Eubacteriales bacterium]
MSKRVVVALGGNAILQPKQEGTAEVQFENVISTCIQLADLIKAGYQLVITHGNGPQVGNILLQNEEAKDKIPPMPLDICGSQTQGFIGYMIQQAMNNLLPQRNVGTILTQVLVDAGDGAFQNPTKPIGPFYTKEQAEQLIAQKGYTMVEDSGRGWRRVVPSPDPKAIIEKELIQALLERDAIVIAAGGGGIPVIKDSQGKLRGIEAVIDKDLAGARLAGDVDADILLILTDVEAVAVNWGKPDQRFLHRLSLQEAGEFMAQGQFKAGSMGPKVEAAIRFVEQGGEKAIIVSLNKAAAALDGHAGTIISK